MKKKITKTIKKSEKIQLKLKKTIKLIELINDDFEFNGKTKQDFMLERLEKAQTELQVLIDYVKIGKEKK